MTRCSSLSPLGSEFDTFLFAPVGEDRNGMLLSVLSVLTRLGVDPWREAAQLARLPGETATLRLASFIAALPAEQTADSAPEMAAARLIALLPRATPFSAPTRATEIGAGGANRLRGAVFALFFSAITVALLISAQLTVANHQQPARGDNPLPGVSSVHAPSTPTGWRGH
ncbi:hypothetical protein DES32_2617 [Methylovirgula ligni]|uniref:Uncharacterized protein n=2 Tax=Methylovirgula ligni TaxID=569860 RepID=A0A3D9YPI5_9HYPH|nr:hypothetical protein DES32_2617 [Methylovirgula ligni]